MAIVQRLTDDEYIARQIASLPHCPKDGQLMRRTETRHELQYTWNFWKCECGHMEIIRSSTARFFQFPFEAMKEFIEWAREDRLRLLSVVSGLIGLVLSITILILTLI
jgi:hypothetical protein